MTVGFAGRLFQGSDSAVSFGELDSKLADFGRRGLGRVRLAIRDRTGPFGIGEHRIEVGDSSLGSVQLGANGSK